MKKMFLKKIIYSALVILIFINLGSVDAVEKTTSIEIGAVSGAISGGAIQDAVKEQEVQQQEKSTTIDGTMDGADSFIKNGEKQVNIDENKLKETSDYLYNLLLGIGIIVVVIVGVIIGMKYMTGSIEEKADMKEVLIGYVVGCLVVFGAFGIWKFAVNILSNM